MQTFSEPGLGTESGPPSASAYKRAVYRQAPAFFSVDVLPPQKQGNSYSYGMRITPQKTESDRYSTISVNSSNSSSGSSSEYDVWRRWEDCLYFQDILENQYTLMSREKRARLQAGKGVKKNGVYPHEDPQHLRRAASFESLPPGPDPNMIAKDVHDFLPKLTKKGTLFRASVTTIEQRGMEFKVLMEALFKEGEDVPTLIVELRQLRIVRDFFGFWRRDHDRVEKEKKRNSMVSRTESLISTSGSTTTRHSSSMFGNAFGMYFSASNLSLQLPSNLAVPERVRYPIVRGGSLSGRSVGRDGDRDRNYDDEEDERYEKSRSSRHPQTAQSSISSEFSRSRKGSTSTSASTSSSRTPLTPTSTSSLSFSTPRPQTQPQPNRSTSRAPPASAPAGMRSFPGSASRPHTSGATPRAHAHSFSYDDDGYNSDTPSVPDSVASQATFHTQSTERARPPRSAPPQFLSMQMGMAGSNVSLGSSYSFVYPGKGKGKEITRAVSELEPEFDAGLRLGEEEETGYSPVPVGAHQSPPNEPVIISFRSTSQNTTLDTPLDVADRRSIASSVDPILTEESFGYDDDHTDMVMREHEHLMPGGTSGVGGEAEAARDVGRSEEGMRFEFDGGGGGVRVALQDLIEEDEEEADALEGLGQNMTWREEPNSSEARGLQNDMSSHDLELAQFHDTETSPPRPVDTPQPSVRAQRRAATLEVLTGNRNGLVFTSPYFAATAFNEDDDEDMSVLGIDSETEFSKRPISIEEALLGFEDGALEMNTARSTPRITSPVPERIMTPTLGSPVSTPTITSVEAGHVHDIDAFKFTGTAPDGRPLSTFSQSSFTSSNTDLKHRFSTVSSMVLHSPLFDTAIIPDRPLTPLSDSELDSRDGRKESIRMELSQSGGSMTSIDSFVSDGVAPGNANVGAGVRRSMSPPPSTISSRMLSDNLRRSLSSGSRRPKRTSQLSVPGSMSSVDVEDELLESYFHGAMSPTTIPSVITEEDVPEAPVVTPGREHFRGALPHPNNFPKPFQNRPPGQFHLPWTPPLISSQIMVKQKQRPVNAFSPPIAAGSNNSSASIDASSIAPSTAASTAYSEDQWGRPLTDTVAIKAMLDDSIVKFRSDRTISLADVRAKLLEKYVKQQDVPLSENFSLAYMPLSGGRLMALKYAGRTRSNSVSSAGTMDPNQLRYIFSEKEWQDAMSCCGPKLNLHVFNDRS